jgi:hypothetical protein
MALRGTEAGDIFVSILPESPWDVRSVAIDRGEEGRAIARAAFLEPEVLGLDRHGVPAIVVGDPSRPAPEGWSCRHAVVFVGGPRSKVVIGTRPSPIGGWDVTARIVSDNPTPITGFESSEDRC